MAVASAVAFIACAILGASVEAVTRPEYAVKLPALTHAGGRPHISAHVAGREGVGHKP